MPPETAAPVVIISHELVGPSMAGPGIRYHHLARVLAGGLPVVLAAPVGSEAVTGHDPYRLHLYQPHAWPSLQPALNGAGAIVAPSDIASHFPQLAECEIPFAIDGYDPLMAETLYLIRQRPVGEQTAIWRERLIGLRQQYQAGDFFFCASERQRDWWLGQLEAHGRINPWTIADDPSLRRLIDVVPYGLDPTPVVPGPPVMRGVWPGIAPDAQIVLWGGGLWPWLDPLTAIRAVKLLVEGLPRLRLVFPGTRHPNPDRAHDTPTLLTAAQDLVRELNLEAQVVFGDWVAYGQWGQVLAESDVALSLHAEESYESRLAFRSRILEYSRADLPAVVTEGDATADLIVQYGVGAQVPAGDAAGVAQALAFWVNRQNRTPAHFQAARDALHWERAVQPLLRFCQQPRHAPDKPALAELDLERRRALADARAQGLALEAELDRVNRMPGMRFVRWLGRLGS